MGMTWKIEEENFLIQNYGTLGPTKCASILNRSYDSVKGRAKKLNLKKTTWNKFTKEQDQFIIKNAYKGGNYIAKALSLNLRSVQYRASFLKINLGPKINKWADNEISFLIENYSLLGPSECAKILSRTVKSVERKGDGLNLRIYKIWALEEDNIIKNKYPTFCSTELSKELNVSLYSLVNRAHHLNVQKKSNMDKKNSSGYLYIIYMPNIELYKVGISANPYNRFSSFCYPVIVKSLIYGNYLEIEKLEKYLLNYILEYKVNTELLPSGNTETYRF